MISTEIGTILYTLKNNKLFFAEQNNCMPLSSIVLSSRLFNDATIMKSISRMFFTIRCGKFELDRYTTHLTVITFQFCFEVFPAIPIFLVIIHTTKNADYIKHRKLPFGFFIIPNSPGFFLIEESHRNFVHLPLPPCSLSNSSTHSASLRCSSALSGK